MPAHCPRFAMLGRRRAIVGWNPVTFRRWRPMAGRSCPRFARFETPPMPAPVAQWSRPCRSP